MTIEYKFALITTECRDKGHSIFLEIVKRYEAINPETVRECDRTYDQTLLQFSHHFSTEKEIEVFMKTKLFKQIMKQCEKYAI